MKLMEQKFKLLDSLKVPNGDTDNKWQCTKCKETFWLDEHYSPKDFHECGVKEYE